MANYPLGPCAPWITGADVTCDAVADPDVLDVAANVASDLLFNLSGMQFTGVCERTVRPGYRKCDCGVLSCGTNAGWLPEWSRWGGSASWTDWGSGWHMPFLCCDADRARLGFSPIDEVTLVEIDGVPLDPSNYAVDEYTWLVRLDDETWPLTDTWEVTFTAGVAPPPTGVLAAKFLACEIAKLIVGDEGCALPQRVTTLTRQGVTMVFDPMEFLDNGKTGIYIVDLFLATHNPDGLHSAPIVAIPNQPTQVVRHT